MTAVFLSALPLAVQAQQSTSQEEDIPQAQSRIVTSVETCLSQLSPADAARVRQSLKPYEDCQNKLKDSAVAKEKEEAEKKKEKPAPAENARNYVRVQPETAGAKEDKDVSSNKSDKSNP